MVVDISDLTDENRICHFIDDIINGMYDWVRVLDRDDNVLFMNSSMKKTFGIDHIGKKCYEVLGRDTPCNNCISRSLVFDGNPHEKEEYISNRTYSVMSSPLYNSEGNIIAVVEVFRDITEMKHLHSEIIKMNTSLKKELNLARKIQQSLLPVEIENADLNFSYVFKPTNIIGGDFLDCFMIDNLHAGIYIADVKGHGVPAAMMTAFLKASMDKTVLSPAKALTLIYKKFNENRFDPLMYITVFYSIVNLKTREITYSNAGHSGSPVLFGEERFDILRVPGVPISNWLERPQYKDLVITMGNKERLFYYTDGLMELKNKANQQYGEEKLLKILLNDSSSNSQLLNKIMKTANDFVEHDDSQYVDDITIACLNIK